jgi:hypothetical protein
VLKNILPLAPNPSTRRTVFSIVVSGVRKIADAATPLASTISPVRDASAHARAVGVVAALERLAARARRRAGHTDKPHTHGIRQHPSSLHPHLRAKSHAIQLKLRFLAFGLWRVYFPPVLVRTGRRLPVQALGERGVLVAATGYPRNGAPGPVEALSQGSQKRTSSSKFDQATFFFSFFFFWIFEHSQRRVRWSASRV